MTGGLEYKSLRVMIAGGTPQSVRVLRTALSLAGVQEITAAADAPAALRLLKGRLFDALFCDSTIDDIDGTPLVVAARREPDVLDHMIPIFLTCTGARLKQVKRARDIGVTDVLAHPISASTIMRKLSLAILKPRSFIAAPTFFGPDRRGKGRAPHAGEERRTRKTRKVRVTRSTASDSEVYI